MASIATFVSLHSVSVQFVEESEYNEALTTAHGLKSWMEGSKITLEYVLGQQPFCSKRKAHGVKAEPFRRNTQGPLFNGKEKDYVSKTSLDSLDLGRDVWR